MTGRGGANNLWNGCVKRQRVAAKAGLKITIIGRAVLKDAQLSREREFKLDGDDATRAECFRALLPLCRRGPNGEEIAGPRKFSCGIQMGGTGGTALFTRPGKDGTPELTVTQAYVK